MEADMRHLTGKVVWVTGSSRGIGRVIAAHQASLGADLAVHGTTPTSMLLARAIRSRRRRGT